MIEAGIPFPDWLRPEIFTIGPVEAFGREWAFPLRWYALAYLAGLFFGWRYAMTLVSTPRLWAPFSAARGAEGRPSMTREQVDDMFIWAILGVILGGRIGYVLFYDTNLIWTDPIQILQVWQGGMSFHGGLLGVALAIVFFCRMQGIGVLRLGDIFAAATPVGLFFGRVANFINGELWGAPTTLPWGVRFPSGGFIPRHPSQLYEAFLEGVVLFAILTWLTWARHSLTRPGLNTGVFLAFYGAARIALEFVREPDAHMVEFYQTYTAGISMGIMLSIPMVAAGVWLIWRAQKNPPVAAMA